MEHSIELKVKGAFLLIDKRSTDRLYLTIDAPSPFPEMKYPAQLIMDFRQGYGEEYCRNVLKLNSDILEVRWIDYGREASE